MAAHEDDGITIIEIVVSLALLGIVLTAFLRVMVGGLESLVDSGQRQDASQLSTEVLENLRAKTPAEVALRYDGASDPVFEVDLSAISNCVVDGDPGFDPDGTSVGPLGCEEFRTSTLGAISSDPSQPYFGTAMDVDVTTVATVATGDNLPAGLTRVTVLMTYDLPDGPQTVRRQTLFSGVARD